MSKGDLKKGAWTHEEDIKLITYIKRYGISNWKQMPKHAGLLRCGKSCRFRWVNYLNPCVKHGNFTKEEDDIIIKKHKMMGTRWSEIAASLPGRTDNQIKNRWHAHLKKRYSNNINLVESTESQKDTFIWDYDNSSQEESIEAYTNMISFSAPEPSKPEGFEVSILMSPDTLNTGALSRFIPTLEENYMGTFNTAEDPYTSFWREPFSLDDVCMENEHEGSYVDPVFELPMAQDWCHEAMINSMTPTTMYDYWFDILSLEDLDGIMNGSNIHF